MRCCPLSALGPPVLGESLIPLARPHHSSRGIGRLPASMTDPTPAPAFLSTQGSGSSGGFFPKPWGISAPPDINSYYAARRGATRADGLGRRAVSCTSKWECKGEGYGKTAWDISRASDPGNRRRKSGGKDQQGRVGAEALSALTRGWNLPSTAQLVLI